MIAIGGSGGSSAAGNAVTVTQYSDVSTRGTAAIDILAQSIGGGGNGGNAFDLSTSIPATGLGGDGGTAGNNGATVNFLAAMSTDLESSNRVGMETEGDNAHPVLLQSIGGGSGGNATGGSVGSLGAF